MVQRVNGGVFDSQTLTGGLNHYVVCGSSFSGAIDAYGQPVPNSAAEIIFNNIAASAVIDIMNPNAENLSFALYDSSSTWDEISLTTMIQSLGTDVGVDHVDCAVCTCVAVPYIWGCGSSSESFLDLTDTPKSYSGAAGYEVIVNPSETGLIFSPIAAANVFSHVAVASQSTINATGSDTLTFIAGTNIVITTNSLTKSVTINSTGGAAEGFVPVAPGTLLTFDTSYYVTSAGTVMLPTASGSGQPAGTFIIITKPVGQTIFVNSTGFDIIATDLGSTNSLEFDATQEILLVFDGASTWNLQIGSAGF